MLTETDLMRQKESAAILPEPPTELKRISRALQQRLRESGDKNGFMDFERYMDMALYEPGLGYYSAGLHKLGASGDFITAPELGSVFAQCLARQVAEIGQQLGDWDILEVGAGTGSLAAELLNALPRHDRPRRYRILERSADLKQQQQQALSAWDIEWLDQPPTEPWQGVVLANEVLDALPVQRFCVTAGGLEQVGVDVRESLHWATRPAPAALQTQLQQALGPILADLPEGYTSEFCPLLPGWLQSLSSSLHQGVLLMVDYGYPRADYYHPERRDGTLVCHYRHRAHGDPFWWPGLQDLSCFVDFTAVAEAARDCGLDYAGYTSQARFLLATGLEHTLAGMEHLPPRERIELSRQVQALTLPGAMGEKFQVMAFCRQFASALSGFAGNDMGHRL